MDYTEPIIRQIEDGRIIKAEPQGFSALINNEWVPVSDFDLKEFWDGKPVNL